ncbi:hypothetical protein EI94DRAFT_1702515 [Lactarius quietus]|nr:hypothetical protein EI94DRAFT_1702515 [Lactarius quietus]
MASEVMQVELQFLAFAAKLFAAAMISSAHPPDDGQQIYLDRKGKDEIVHTSLENQFNTFMGDPMKVRKKPRIHPIIQMMAQEWRAAEAEQRMPNWGIFTLDYVSEHCNAQREAHTDWHLHISTLDFTVYLQGIPDDRHWWITGLPPPQGDPDTIEDPAAPMPAAWPTPPFALSPPAPRGSPDVIYMMYTCRDDNLIGTGLTQRADILIAYPSYFMPPKAASELTQVETQFLAIAARLFTAAMTFLAHPPDDGQQAYLVRKVKDEIILVGNQFKKFMGDPSKHTKKPRMHPIIQIMSEEWKAAEVEQRMPDWGIFTLDHISGYYHAQREAHSDWHPDLSTLDLSRYLQGLQNHRRWWVTGLPPPQGDVDVAMEVMAAPAQPSAPVSAASPMMPDAPATSKGKARALPPAGSSDPYDMDSTPSAQGRASDTSLPRVQVDDASPPPPAQRRHLDVQPLVATGDYRCGTCKNPKVNNAECVSQINDNRLTYKCAFCAERRRPCAPAASWAQPIVRLMKFRNLDLPPGVEAAYGPSAVGTSSISPGENLESRVNSLEAKMDYVIPVLNALAGTQGIIPSSLPGYIQLPPARRSASPSHHSLSSPGLAITSLGLTDLPSESQSRSSSRSDSSDSLLKHNVGEAALRPLCTSEAEVLETPAARQPSSNEIVVSHLVYVCTSLMIWRLARCQG